MNKEFINKLRLDAGIARLDNNVQLVCINRDGKVIDPIDGLAIFAELIITECLDIVIDSDPSEKMTLTEPYGTIVDNIKVHFGISDE